VGKLDLDFIQCIEGQSSLNNSLEGTEITKDLHSNKVRRLILLIVEK